MIAIFRREISAYFNSALAWSLIAAFTLIVSFVFVTLLGKYSADSLGALSSPFGAQGLNPTNRVITPTFSWMGYLLLFILPLLTMRLFAEENRQGTLEMLFTYPLTDLEIVLGKFFGGMSVVTVFMAITSGFFVALDRLIDVEWKVVLVGYLGIFLLGCAFVSFGLWASSLTSMPMVAGAITYGGLLASWIIQIADENVRSLKEIFGELSSMAHFQEMSRGELSTHHVVYYLAWTCLFLFLTLRTLESRKWSS